MILSTGNDATWLRDSHQRPMKDTSGHMMEACLARDSVRRVLLSLIAVEQERLIKAGVVAQEKALTAQSIGATDAQIDRLSIDETSLGFDSLSRLDLVLRVNQFFQLHTTGVEDYLLVKRRVCDWVELIMQHFLLLQTPTQIAFLTSGSTGAPKTIIHEMRALQAEVTTLLAGPVPMLQPSARVLSLVPPHHIYGFLFSCILPTMAGCDTIDLHQQTPTRGFTVAQAGDLVIATPYIWERLIKSGLQFQPGVRGISAGAPTTTTTWSVLEMAGLSSLTEVYGATETGGIGFRQASDDAFHLLAHLERADAHIRHADTVDKILDIQDKINWTGPRRFTISGRRDDVVQVAGVNVAPQHVAEQIGKVFGVNSVDIRVSAGRLHALIIPSKPDDPTNALEQRIRAHLLQHLAPPARPATLTFRATRPCNDMGKLQDWTGDQPQWCD
ncbi:4-coumarate--CoA ligase [Yoonia maricola]|uniref:4-coumarate--CoA ligase n=1 Tax=Yoonia maricola TaxID=420999 RepID=A0A2M8WKK7_9RHOB|nr:4-coumarate--CoA ligase [Yoonia maricola]PJI91440.1 4-coumarate--CoA ligase [Yoonia maricola]